MFLDVAHIQVKLVDVLGVLEEEGTLGVKTEGENIFYRIFHKLCYLVKVAILSEYVLIIVTYLDDDLNTECFL